MAYEIVTIELEEQEQDALNQLSAEDDFPREEQITLEEIFEADESRPSDMEMLFPDIRRTVYFQAVI